MVHRDAIICGSRADELSDFEKWRAKWRPGLHLALQSHRHAEIVGLTLRFVDSSATASRSEKGYEFLTRVRCVRKGVVE